MCTRGLCKTHEEKWRKKCFWSCASMGMLLKIHNISIFTWLTHCTIKHAYMIQFMLMTGSRIPSPLTPCYFHLGASFRSRLANTDDIDRPIYGLSPHHLNLRKRKNIILRNQEHFHSSQCRTDREGFFLLLHKAVYRLGFVYSINSSVCIWWQTFICTSISFVYQPANRCFIWWIRDIYRQSLIFFIDT